METKPSKNFIRYTLSVLLGFLALNAFAGGYYGMAGAKNVPLDWLKGSPFNNYFIPGLFLFFIIGGLALVASVTVFKRSPLAHKTAFICGIIVLLWLAVQVLIIGYVSWMQPVAAITAVIILLLTSQLPRSSSLKNNNTL